MANIDENQDEISVVSVVDKHQSKIQSEYDALDAAVVAAGGVLTTDMRDLRDRVGAGKLGRYVVQSIEDELERRGLGHSALTLEQWHDVRLWKKGKRVGSFIEAALVPGNERDELLRELADSKADDILKQVRALVCE